MLRRIVLFAGLAAVHSAALAETHALAVKGGVLGLGLEYSYAVASRVSVRAGLNSSGFSFDAEESGVAYEFDVVWDSISLAVDFHPRNSPLRLTVGALRNGNRLDASSRLSDNIVVGGTTYTADEVGTLVGRVTFKDVATFLGVGWDWSRSGRPFGLSLDLGIVSQGEPHVSLRAQEGMLSDSMFADDIAAERAELQEALSDLDLMPYASLGFVFRF
jgi:hypothetical protein